MATTKWAFINGDTNVSVQYGTYVDAYDVKCFFTNSLQFDFFSIVLLV